MAGPIRGPVGVDLRNDLGWKGHGLGRTIANASGLPQMVSDAKWSFTHPIDRLAGRGRAEHPTMEFPGPFKAVAMPFFANRYANLFKKGGQHVQGAIDKANQQQLVFGNRDIQEKFLNLLPPIPEKPRAGRAYRVPNLGSDMANDANNNSRVVMVQDPRTGTIYATTGGAHHGDLERALKKSHGLDRDEIPFAQHELFPPSNDQMVPSRLNWQVWEHADSRRATLARARLIRQMAKNGMVSIPDKTNHGRWYYSRKDLESEDNPWAGLLQGAREMGLLRPPRPEMSPSQAHRLAQVKLKKNKKNAP